MGRDMIKMYLLVRSGKVFAGRHLLSIVGRHGVHGGLLIVVAEGIIRGILSIVHFGRMGAAEAIGVTGYRVGAAEVVDEGAVADSEEVAVALIFSACMSASDMPMGA
jgi:hypothetical protein